MFDWIQNLALEAESTTKIVVSAIAIIVAVVLCHRGGWALARIIISVLSVAILIAALNNLDLFANRVETEVRGGPAVSGVYQPAGHGDVVSAAGDAADQPI